ncbi:MAG: NADPH-dependent 7-cyano-7-deazaguanine reductase QueF [Gammaproteobacteria bacterium RIFCSPHIGHO2_02_FULL_39_13]|nr:MAG: NADPH-dependent 7-cyano-7-deazaguanine reductase QueF [Gammaproteobacteria bacterium RIFCSPHIGHO2_02_FULL_39_13]
MHITHTSPKHSTLGKKTDYKTQYDASLLFPIARENRRGTIGITNTLPFFGFDIWNHYEVSWLNQKGKPIVAIAHIIYPAASKNIIESKSLKLYFNSFNNTCFESLASVKKTIERDLLESLETELIAVTITPTAVFSEEKLQSHLNGIGLDELDIDFDIYRNDPTLLMTENEWVEETLYSDLLRSNCLITNQPDWCSVQINYKGKKINHAGLLRYLVSFRNDNEFHEHCIEKIFMHIMQRCNPTELTVYGRSTRRGGLDINSYRSTKPVKIDEIRNIRLCRQ